MSALTPERLAEIRERAGRAADHVARICTEEDRWTMSVPVRDTDSDVLLMEVAETDVPALLAEVERFRAGIGTLHRPVHPVFSWSDGLRFDEPCPDCHGKAGVHPCGCWADEDTQYECLECIKPRGGSLRRHVPWPCETAALLNPTEGETDAQR